VFLIFSQRPILS